MSPNLSSFALQPIAEMPWDILIIGGGITGAGIMREAARHNLRVLLVEQNDFASGTSSRSSKLVHGGLNYLIQFQLGMVRDAVRERNRLIHDGGGLVEPLEFLIPICKEDGLPDWLVTVGLGAYNLLAGRFAFPRRIINPRLERWAPDLNLAFSHAFSFEDAKTDDARLVLRVLQHGCQLGGHALNYVAATEILRNRSGDVTGARVKDRQTGSEVDVRASVVINATGPWADQLRHLNGSSSRLRLVRGSHLVFPADRIPIKQAIAAKHPDSRRPTYLIPWEGVTLVGSTNIEHAGEPDKDIVVSPEEATYLLRSVQQLFPSLDVSENDVISSFAGIRPIVDRHTLDPARASRDFAIWEEGGMLTVTGGKLTTFGSMATHVLMKLRKHFPQLSNIRRDSPILDNCRSLDSDIPLDDVSASRLLARYGPEGLSTIAAMPDDEHQRISDTAVLWGELRWSARTEAVRHLDDLLLRRLRIGLTTPEGGAGLLGMIRPVVQSELGWDDNQWDSEVETYQALWHQTHSVPAMDHV